MKITLAWPQEGIGDADQTVDVSDADAKRLVNDGMARWADLVPTAAADVEAVAAMEGIDLSGAGTVAEKRARVKAARANEEG